MFSKTSDKSSFLFSLGIGGGWKLNQVFRRGFMDVQRCRSCNTCRDNGGTALIIDAAAFNTFFWRWHNQTWSIITILLYSNDDLSFIHLKVILFGFFTICPHGIIITSTQTWIYHSMADRHWCTISLMSIDSTHHCTLTVNYVSRLNAMLPAVIRLILILSSLEGVAELVAVRDVKPMQTRVQWIVVEESHRLFQLKLCGTVPYGTLRYGTIIR